MKFHGSPFVISVKIEQLPKENVDNLLYGREAGAMSLRLFFFFLCVVCCSFGLQHLFEDSAVFKCAIPALTQHDSLNCLGQGVPVRGAYGWLLNSKISLNDARWSDLVKVRGIGAALAHAIITQRAELGRFRDWNEVDAIAGVGTLKLKLLQSVCHL
jgi:hypothetical protein